MDPLRTGLLLLALAATQKDQGDAARRRFDELMTSCAQAAALDYACELNQTEGAGDERTEWRFGIEVHAAWPNRGRILFWSLDDTSAPEDESLPSRIGDGSKVYFLDHGAKTYQAIGDEWTLVPPGGPMEAFHARQVPKAGSVTAVAADEAHAGLAGLRCDYGSGHVETVWLDAGGKLVALEADLGGGDTESVRFTQWKVSSEVSPEVAETYAAAFPDGYTEAPDLLAQLEAELLPVGEAAPDVELTGLDDQTFRLSSLRGKTLLVNFWFYH